MPWATQLIAKSELYLSLSNRHWRKNKRANNENKEYHEAMQKGSIIAQFLYRLKQDSCVSSIRNLMYNDDLIGYDILFRGSDLKENEYPLIMFN